MRRSAKLRNRLISFFTIKLLWAALLLLYMYKEGEMAVFFLLFQPAFLSLQFAMFLYAQSLTVSCKLFDLSFAMFLLHETRIPKRGLLLL